MAILTYGYNDDTLCRFAIGERERAAPMPIGASYWGLPAQANANAFRWASLLGVARAGSAYPGPRLLSGVNPGAARMASGRRLTQYAVRSVGQQRTMHEEVVPDGIGPACGIEVDGPSASQDLSPNRGERERSRHGTVLHPAHGVVPTCPGTPDRSARRAGDLLRDRQSLQSRSRSKNASRRLDVSPHVGSMSESHRPGLCPHLHLLVEVGT